MTVAQAWNQAAAELAASGVDSPRLDARLLLQWTLKARWEDLVREPERDLNTRAQLIYDKAIALRAQRRPLPYITGEQWFYGRLFKINRAVLIPRPETELLVEAALAACRGMEAPVVADIGTGSGCIAVTLAAEIPTAHVWAVDLSADALTLACKNVLRHGTAERVTLREGDLVAPLPPELRFDVIVSNPPYIPAADMPHLQPEVRNYEPVLALSGAPGATGADGARLHRLLVERAPERLRPGGRLLLEVGQGQAASVAAYAAEWGFGDIRVIHDFGGIGRVVSAGWPGRS